jgi:predicted O-methyltransferase YrrM
MTYADQLVDKWANVLEECKFIPTWTERASLAYCAEVASRASYMVELGTYLGASALVMLNANPRLHLWCVDIFTAFAFNEQVAAHFLEYEIQQGRCELIKGDSLRAAEMLQHMRGRLDAVWVDDGHATEDVKRDIRAFLPLLKPGGILFGHDFEVPHNDVALGVIASLPWQSWTIPVPRVWSYTKQG